MKIIFFIPSLDGGGAERVALNLAKECNRLGYDLYVAVGKSGGKLTSDMETVATIVDFKKDRISKCILPLAKTIDEIRPQAVLSFMDHCNIILVLSSFLAKYSQYKKILSVHNNLEVNLTKNSKIKGFFVKFFVRLLYKNADFIVAVSKGVKESLINFVDKSVKDKIQVIYNPSLDINIKRLASEEIVWPFKRDGEKIICAIGRLTHQKGFDLLIEAFAKTKLNNVKLIILGEGEQRELLTTQISNLGLYEQVFLVGFDKNPYKYLSKADLFVFSSRWEGFGVALIEALYLGLNVISFDCNYGPREILSNGKYGKLIEKENINDLAKAMNENLNLKPLTVPDSYFDQFSVSKVFAQYEKLWNQ